MGDGKKTEVAQEPAGAFTIKSSSLLVGILALLVLVNAYNQYQLMTLSTLVTKVEARSSVQLKETPNAGNNAEPDTRLVQLSDVRPTGTPAIYGDELGIRYDDVSENNAALADATIRKFAQHDQEISLTGEALTRYIKIASAISCEYCCGAESVIFSNGQAACGCAHSYAMRGLAKYLIKNHGSEYTDDQILEELGKWKVLFFPGVHAEKAAVLKEKGIELNFINLASNKYRGIEQGAQVGGGSSMVGGC